jgi:hypothetical protein
MASKRRGLLIQSFIRVSVKKSVSRQSLNPCCFRFGVIDAGSLVVESLKWKNAPERKSCIVGEMEIAKKTLTGGDPIELSFDTGF